MTKFLQRLEIGYCLMRGLIASIPIAIIVTGALVSVADSRYALVRDSDRLQQIVEAHLADDVHMSESEKRREFVTRIEWSNGRDRTNKDLDEIKGYLKEQRNLSLQILREINQ